MRPVYVLLTCAAVALAIATWVAIGESGVPKLQELDGERARLSAETEALKRENAALQAEAELLRTDATVPSGALEKAAREELGYVKNGEVVVIDDEGPR